MSNTSNNDFADIYVLLHEIVDKLNWFTEDKVRNAHAVIDSANPNVAKVVPVIEPVAQPVAQVAAIDPTAVDPAAIAPAEPSPAPSDAPPVA